MGVEGEVRRGDARVEGRGRGREARGEGRRGVWDVKEGEG